MDKDRLRALDREESERADHLLSAYDDGKPLKADEVFRFERVRDVYGNHTLLSGVVKSEILLSIPFYKTVLVEVCIVCAKALPLNDFLALCDSNIVIPVLQAPYATYDPDFVAPLLSRPHISYREFDVWRRGSLWALDEERVCSHCVDKRLNATLRRSEIQHNTDLTDRVRQVYAMLDPFLGPDYLLLEFLDHAIAERDLHKVDQVEDLAWTLRNIRTCQAYDIPYRLRVPQLDLGQSHLSKETLPDVSRSINEFRRTALEGLGVEIPLDAPIEDLIEVLVERSDPLRETVDSMLTRATKGGEVSFAELMNQISLLNEHLHSIQRSGRYQVFRGAVTFARSNRTLVAAALVGGVLGLAGSASGCGVSLATGAASWLLEKSGKIEIPSNQRRQRVVHRYMEPAVTRILSAYLGIDLGLVQLLRTSEDMADLGGDAPA